MRSVLEMALAYAAKGWKVFPTHTRRRGKCSCAKQCSSPAKHPVTKRGLLDAATDPVTIRDWWRRWPWANVAVATGAGSGIVVLDVDVDKGGTDSLIKLRAEIILPATLTSHTGGGGLHYLFAHPGQPVKTRARAFGPGLDVRGDGGYIIAPPSTHISGTPYTWEDEHTPTAPFPTLLTQLLAASKVEVPRSVVPSRLHGQGGTPYGLTALQRMVDELAATPEGARNDTLNATAYAAARLIAGGELEREPTLAALSDAAAGTGLGRVEIDRTIASAFGAGMVNPRSAPPRPPSGPPATASSNGAPVMPDDGWVPPEHAPDEDAPPGQQSDPTTVARSSQEGFEPLQVVDLATIARDGIPAPDLLCGGLIYRGSLHSLAGPPDCGKSTLLYWWSILVLAAGGHVVLLDEESGHEQVVEKFLALGAEPDHLERVHYVEYPARTWAGTWGNGPDHRALASLLDQVQPALIGFDSSAAFLAQAGLDENAAPDVTRFYKGLLLEAARNYGCAVVILDHLGKDQAGGRYARGSGAKLANVDVAFMLDPITPFTRETSGLIKVTVTKDRRGYLHRKHEMHVAVDDGAMALKVVPDDVLADGEFAGLSPAARKLLFALRNATWGTGEMLTATAIVDLVAAEHGHGLRVDTVRKSLNRLLEAGLVDVAETSEHGTKLWIATRPEQRS